MPPKTTPARPVRQIDIASVPPDPYSGEPFGPFFVLFRHVPGWHGYGVDTSGKVWSCVRLGRFRGVASHWRELRPARQKSGHHFVGFSTGIHRSQVLFRVHRLVALCFLGPCPEGMQVRHLDGNPQNNSLRNLAYGTQLQNSGDAQRHGQTCPGMRNGMAKLTSDQVTEIRCLRAEGLSCQKIGNLFRVSRSTVSLIARGERWRIDIETAKLLEPQRELDFGGDS